MAFERRLVACVLLFAMALPLLLSLLPDQVETAAVPIGAVLATAVVLLLPAPRFVAPIAWSAAAGTVIFYTAHFVPMEGFGWLLVVVLATTLLTDRALLGLAAASVATACLGYTPQGPEVGSLVGFSTRFGVDALGPVAAASWVVWLGMLAVRARSARARDRQQQRTAAALDLGIERDFRRLGVIARTVACPSLTGPVEGQGLGADGLAMAARVDEHTVLLGWIEGPPLATLTVGWGLLSAARAGLHRPRALLRLARTHFDEVVPATGVRWLALWDRRANYVHACPVAGGALGRCRLTALGPVAAAPASTRSVASPALDAFDTDATLAELTALPTEPEDAIQPQGRDRVRQSLPLLAAWGACLGLGVVAFASTFLIRDPLWVVLTAVGLVASHGLARATARRATSAVHETAKELAERIEIHDDVRFELARHHGTLLPYRIEAGGVRATAHRLRGEVLDGSFADMFVDGSGAGQIVAGEVAGRGIPARFLGLSAQMILRVWLEGHARPLAEARRDLRDALRRFGTLLGFPVRVRLGATRLGPDGVVTGSGCLESLAIVRAPQRADLPAAPEELGRVSHEVRIDASTRAYLTPGPSRPGPEDDAPPLGSPEIAERVVDMVTSARWSPQDGSLASLFALVFDGRAAPAHGTLIELSRTPNDSARALP